MRVADFSKNVLQPLEATSKKLEQTRLLAEFLHSVNADEVAPFLYLVLGQTGPVYANQEYNFGLQFMLYALSLVEGTVHKTDLFGAAAGLRDEEAKQQMKKRFKKLGDIGQLAEEAVRGAGGNGSLGVKELYERLLKVTQLGGQGSQDEKIRAVAGLLRELDPLSARYVARMIMGHLRLGFSDKTILDALSWYLKGDKSVRKELDDVYQRHPDIGEIAAQVLRGGLAAAQQLDAALRVPILAALCDRIKTPAEVIAKMGEVFVEPKYDGTRLQIHWNAQTKELHTYTRNLEENTPMFPELPKLLADADAQTAIFDAEAVGYDPESGGLVTFQQTIKRKRKHGIEAAAASIPLRFFVFDLLYLDGKSLLREPLAKRRAHLERVLKHVRPDLVVAPHLRTSDPEELRAFHQKQLGAGLEGVVIKRVDGFYQPGRQAFNWVKMKEAAGTSAKLSDTIDAVVLGTYAGRGKRTAFGVGAFLIGILDPSRDAIVTIAKIGTGLSDEQWRELKERANKIAAKGPGNSGYQIDIPELLQPDVMLAPELVVEVAADEITKSPLHTAGVALRFPRLVRFRDDKNVADITTVKELAKIRVA
jgi:DNA ligase-1